MKELTGAIKTRTHLLTKNFRRKKKYCLRTMSNGNGNGSSEIRIGTSTVKMGLAQMLKGGVIVSSKHTLKGFGEV
jgi:hypothetical protein